MHECLTNIEHVRTLMMQIGLTLVLLSLKCRSSAVFQFRKINHYCLLLLKTVPHLSLSS